MSAVAPRTLHIHQRLLGKNAEIARSNRERFHAHRLLTLNLLSSPGAGKTALLERLLADFPNEVQFGAPDQLFIRTKEGPRTPFFLVKDYLIDIPRTMFSLALSPRLERSNRTQSLRSNMESVLIGRFFEGVKKNLKRDRNIKESLFHFGGVDDVSTIIKTGMSKTWD